MYVWKMTGLDDDMSKSIACVIKYERKVNYGVAASDLLEELTGSADESTPQVLRWTVGEDMLDLKLADGFQRLYNDTLLLLGARGVNGLGRQSCNNVLALNVLASGEEITRRLRQLRYTDDEKDSEDNLKTNGQAPGDGAVNIRETEVDPVGDD